MDLCAGLPQRRHTSSSSSDTLLLREVHGFNDGLSPGYLLVFFCGGGGYLYEYVRAYAAVNAIIKTKQMVNAVRFGLE